MMATRIVEDGSTLSVRESCQTNSLPAYTHINDRSGGRNRKIFEWKSRTPGSKNVIFIIAWFFILSCSLWLSIKQHELKVSANIVGDSSNLLKLFKSGHHAAIVLMVYLFLTPLAGFLAEVVVSRYKLVSYSLKASWFLSLIGCSYAVIAQYLVTSDLFKDNTELLLTLEIALILGPQLFFFGAVLSSVVPLGMDQILSGSNTNISSFVHWLVWVTFAGSIIPYNISFLLVNCTKLLKDEVVMILSLLAVVLLSVGLVLDFLFSHKLVREPVTVNPVTLIFKVLKYAVKHKRPVLRSAFTYCDDEKPSRLDYGKTKYGGPFTTEQVEDVKTFWRVLLVLLAITTFTVSVLPQVLLTYSHYEIHSKLFNTIINQVSQPYVLCLFLIPLYELLVYPCLMRNRGTTILRSVMIGAATLVIASLYGTLFETIKHHVSYIRDDTCLIVNIPVNLLLAVFLVIFLKSSTEFVCAQAPYNMRGLLIGLSFTATIVCISLGELVYWAGRELLKSSLWFHLAILILTLGLCVLLGCVVKWYRARERDELRRSQAMVEEIYYKYQK